MEGEWASKGWEEHDETMQEDAQKWLENRCEDLMRRVGVSAGMMVLDFGSNAGYYTRNVAKVVGETGKVYALDKNEEALETVACTANEQDLNNIECLHVPEDQDDIPLPPASIDMVLLYDVLHGGYFPESHQRRTILSRIHEVLKPRGLLSLYPTHLKKYGLTFEQILSEVKKTGFQLEDEARRRLVHDGNLVRGRIFSFRREKEKL
ncbi:MAG: class I SAM-dependent methyltransferase [Planctomycetota bacterium]